MKQTILILVLFHFHFLVTGQTENKDIFKIKTRAQAETFIDANPRSDGKLFLIKSGQDAAEILSPLYNKNPGYTFKIDNYTYKLIEVDSVLSFRVSYIYLDGSKYSKAEIDKLREDIIAKYKSGESFTRLVEKYNMDGNTSGDTNWFTEKMMVEEFEKAVKSHKKGEIFIVDTPEQNWYHVVLKTYNDTFLKNFTLLKVKSSR